MTLADRILYRDGLILVIDKPAGLPVHGGPGGGDNLERHFDALRFGLPRAPALAHRLDRDTSGCLILGRHPKALRRIGRLFTEGRVQKTYWAVTRGAPDEPEGRIALALEKVSTRADGWRMIVSEAGKAAVTDYRVLASGDGLAFIELAPKTGRTHQIRAHLAAIGCPILGDPRYGDLSADDRAPPMHLHARALTIPLYASKPPIEVQAEPPAPMCDAIARLRPRAGT